MNDFNCFSVSTYSEFVREVEPCRGQIVCLCLTQRHVSDSYQAGDQTVKLPAKRLTLDLQAFNIYGDLVWLSQSLRESWPPDKDDKAALMTELRDIVRDNLVSRYEVQIRDGLYLMPDSWTPIGGSFDCAEWYKDDDGHIRVKASER